MTTYNVGKQIHDVPSSHLLKFALIRTFKIFRAAQIERTEYLTSLNLI